jgi:hypothetical protein
VTVRERVAARPVFTLGEETFSWGDVVAAAQLDGSWKELEATSRQGLACRMRLTASPEELPQEEVVAATTRFRYTRNLLAGEELNEWLDHWGLDVSQWHEYMTRYLLRERWAGELADTLERYSVIDEDVAGVVWAEAVCSGFLPRYAQRLAGACALAVAAGEPIGASPAALTHLKAVADQARRDAVTDEAVAREVAQHRLEWLRIDGDVLGLPTEDVAREAALCVRDDGRPLAEVAEEAGSEAATLRAYVEDLDAELAAALVGAQEGELVGPIEREDGFTLVVVRRKTPPDAADPDVRRRAEERIVARTADRAVLDHVEWHERL